MSKQATDRSLSQKEIKRAWAVLLLELLSSTKVAAMLNCAANTIRKWCKRFQDEGLNGLKGLPRSGRPKLFKSRFKLEVVDIVCQKPIETFLPGTTHWSIRNLAMILHRLLNIKIINPESVRKMEYYLTRTGPDFFSKAERILNIYQSSPSGDLVISFDERAAIQVMERLYPGTPLRPGCPEMIEFHYRRHPTFTLLAGLCIKSGHLFGRYYQRNAQYQFLDSIEQLDGLYGDVNLYSILDN